MKEEEGEEEHGKDVDPRVSTSSHDVEQSAGSTLPLVQYVATLAVVDAVQVLASCGGTNIFVREGENCRLSFRH